MGQVRIPQQQRSLETKKRIEKAAFQLFSKKGIHGTTSREIAATAGVSTGSFYSYFKNKKELLLKILEDFLDRTYLAIWKDLGNYTTDNLTYDDIHSIITNVFKVYDIAPRFLSQTHALRYSDPDINRIFERERQREAEQILNLIQKNTHRLDIPDPYATAIIAHNAVEHAAHTVKFIGPKIEEERLIKGLTDLIYGFFLLKTENTINNK